MQSSDGCCNAPDEPHHAKLVCAWRRCRVTWGTRLKANCNPTARPLVFLCPALWQPPHMEQASVPGQRRPGCDAETSSDDARVVGCARPRRLDVSPALGRGGAAPGCVMSPKRQRPGRRQLRGGKRGRGPGAFGGPLVGLSLPLLPAKAPARGDSGCRPVPCHRAHSWRREQRILLEVEFSSDVGWFVETKGARVVP
jgi:hypothetical protein